ncbi:MAG: hypothetical protein IT203_08160 [Fimbriimonadaceae bacterium]|nr:hypothetical protein [Fimbriimonadaceae bacterium]
MILQVLAFSAMQTTAEVLKARGFEVLEQIRRDYYLPETRLYCEEVSRDGKKSGPAFNWGVGVMLSALNAAAKLDPKYKPWLREFADASRIYWNEKGPVPGYDVLPCPKPVDRYYDDNAWMVLALVEAFEVLRDKKYLDWAEDGLKYVLSGWDDKLGGGIYWREGDKKSKNTCSNAPSAAACFAVGKYRNGQKLGNEGRRILAWTQKLMDPSDGLFWDNISLAGKIEKTKWSYNTGLVLRSMAMEEAKFGEGTSPGGDGKASPTSAMAKWFDPIDGSMKDAGKFAHLLIEGLWAHSPRSAELRLKTLNALEFVYANVRDSKGRYGGNWGAPLNPNQAKFELIDQASAARAFLFTAASLKSPRSKT